jgi:hypothetical protein
MISLAVSGSRQTDSLNCLRCAAPARAERHSRRSILNGLGSICQSAGVERSEGRILRVVPIPQSPLTGHHSKPVQQQLRELRDFRRYDQNPASRGGEPLRPAVRHAGRARRGVWWHPSQVLICDLHVFLLRIQPCNARWWQIPSHIPPDKIEEAASLSRGDRWSEEVALTDMPGLDAIVCGSVAVTRDGRRCGKGEGYSDLEFAILRELCHPLVPVATTVHDLQVVDSVPRDPTDQPLSMIATPTQTIRIKRPSAALTGIDWTRLSAEDLEEMPVLAELKRMTTSNA